MQFQYLFFGLLSGSFGSKLSLISIRPPCLPAVPVFVRFSPKVRPRNAHRILRRSRSLGISVFRSPSVFDALYLLLPQTFQSFRVIPVSSVFYSFFSFWRMTHERFAVFHPRAKE